MRRLREETQEKARRGEGRKAAAEGQGREEGAQESREAGGEGQGAARAEFEAKAERQVEWRASERVRREIRRGQNDCREIRDIRQARGQARSGNRRFGLALQLPFLKVSESMGNHDSNIVDAGSVD